MNILITNYFILKLILTNGKKPPSRTESFPILFYTSRTINLLIRYHYMHRAMASHIWIDIYLTKHIITILKIGKKFLTLNLWFEKFSGKKVLIFLIWIIIMKYFCLTKNNFYKKKWFSLIWIIIIKYFCLTKNKFFLMLTHYI